MSKDKTEILKQKISILERMIEESSRELYISNLEVRKMALFAEHNPSPVIRIDSQGFILKANPATNKVFENITTGMKWEELIKSGIQEEYEDLIKNNGTKIIEVIIHEHIYLFQYQGITKENFINIYGFDITEQKKLEQEIESERAYNIHQSKLATIGEMAGGVAHEINTPLGVITLTASQIASMDDQTKIENLDMINECVADIDGAATRIKRIVDSLRNFSRNDTTTLTFTNINTILEESLTLCYSQIKQNNIDLKINYLKEGINIECNPTQITQIIVNLLNNAKDALVDMNTEKWITVDIQNKESFIEIIIIDSGSGIPQEIADNIFNPFYTTKDINKGTGLGLAISYRMAKAHKGDLYLDPTDKNTKFVLKLQKYVN